MEFITGYIIEYYVGDRDLKNIPQRRLDLVDRSISSHCSILDSIKWRDVIRQENELAAVIGDIEYVLLWEKVGDEEESDGGIVSK